MIAELAKPIVVILCILCLYSVFYVAFLDPINNVEQRIEESLGLVALAGGISIVSGLIFREAAQSTSDARARLTSTLPVQMFCWTAGAMVILFFACWYPETHCALYRDVRIWV